MSISRAIIARLNQTSLIDNLVYTSRHGPTRGLRRQGGMGWLPSFVPRSHEWDAEEAFLANIDWSGQTVFDVGGDQGLFTLFFADRVGPTGQVVVFEPNPISYRRIQQNIQHNNFGNIRTMPMGLGEKADTLQFYFPLLQPAQGTADPAIAEQFKRSGDVTPCNVEVNSLDNEMEKSHLPVPDFIKMDVEGMEYPALRGMINTLQTHRPRLSIEIHGANMEEKLANVSHVIGFLEELNYRILHIESGRHIGSDNAILAREGHLYCEPSDS